MLLNVPAAFRGSETTGWKEHSGSIAEQRCGRPISFSPGLSFFFPFFSPFSKINFFFWIDAPFGIVHNVLVDIFQKWNNKNNPNPLVLAEQFIRKLLIMANYYINKCWSCSSWIINARRDWRDVSRSSSFFPFSTTSGDGKVAKCHGPFVIRLLRIQSHRKGNCETCMLTCHTAVSNQIKSEKKEKRSFFCSLSLSKNENA